MVTSASPAEGKTFTAVNLALAQAQLEQPGTLADLDLRRPVVHNLLQCERTPGFSDFLLAEKPLEECIRRIGTRICYFMPAGTQVKNPLEMLNMRQVKYTLDAIPKDLQLDGSGYAAAAVLGGRESARHPDRWDHDRGPHRLDDVR